MTTKVLLILVFTLPSAISTIMLPMDDFEACKLALSSMDFDRDYIKTNRNLEEAMCVSSSGEILQSVK